MEVREFILFDGGLGNFIDTLEDLLDLFEILDDVLYLSKEF